MSIPNNFPYTFKNININETTFKTILFSKDKMEVIKIENDIFKYILSIEFIPSLDVNDTIIKNYTDIINSFKNSLNESIYDYKDITIDFKNINEYNKYLLGANKYKNIYLLLIPGLYKINQKNSDNFKKFKIIDPDTVPNSNKIIIDDNSFKNVDEYNFSFNDIINNDYLIYNNSSNEYICLKYIFDVNKKNDFIDNLDKLPDTHEEKKRLLNLYEDNIYIYKNLNIIQKEKTFELGIYPHPDNFYEEFTFKFYLNKYYEFVFIDLSNLFFEDVLHVHYFIPGSYKITELFDDKIICNFKVNLKNTDENLKINLKNNTNKEINNVLNNDVNNDIDDKYYNFISNLIYLSLVGLILYFIFKNK